MKNSKALLLLEDGTIFSGRYFGYRTEKTAEIVFNTAHTGYEEIITDPSYSGQMVVFTVPHIGNYGINYEDSESYKIWVDAIIVKEFSKTYSNYRAKTDLDSFLRMNKVIGLEGIDTRKLVKKIRDKGAMKALITCRDTKPEILKKKLKQFPDIGKLDLVRKVNSSPYSAYKKYISATKNKKTVVVLDYGVKLNIIKSIENLGFNVKVLAANSNIAEVLKHSPVGIVLSNGPGDPENVLSGVELASDLVSYNKKKYLPVLGICLGHQLIGLGVGAKTYKLKFGHHGSNHPVKNLETSRIEITSQNHNYCVDPESLPTGFKITHINLNDNSLEGFKHNSFPVICFQYHPESAPGPHDSRYIFKYFKALIDE